ncbi:small acid-soluble spore protein Tlp [Lysinibacillus antri]|uniref:Small acid-soluble spore protein Tlp n=2 Tax=Lysinibacillus TaxID=400634 RepID=A0A3S0RVR6_9BACI|nr:small acid-soluble spore protein Tlp [Lysinibacillus antri]RUL52245.1 small acid-soluble spore protein Tlp [Lysinibacillus antri]TSI05305.1 small acid-soluble spore protein Tlp [Lysinibacillus sp. BW-2-10]
MKQNPQHVAGRPKKFVSKQEMIENTLDNMREAEISMEFAGEEELENLQEKNERRKHAIQRMKNEKLT